MPRILKNAGLCILGSAILAFGLCHVHAMSSVTEGGVLGLTLWLYHTFSLSPALTSLLLNAACYLFGLRVLGLSFIGYSAVAGGGFSLFYFLFDLLPPVFGALSAHPLLAALLGALFVGVGVGLCVVAGGAPSGDDALAMSLAAKTKKDIRIFYLVSDLLVLALSLTYIPITRILYSLLTVILSGQIIGLIQHLSERIRRI